MGEVKDFLDGHLRGMAAPFLFVGSGLSQRYAHLEDWEGLLRLFAGKTDKPYEYYRTSAEGDLPTVASKIAEAFHQIWWTEDEYEQSRDEWSAKLRGTESALKVEVAKHFIDIGSRLPKKGELKAEVELLRHVVVDGIITTNFDPLMETLFPEFRVFVGQDEMLFSNPQGIGEIYKIHGGHTDPDSLVLSAADYERFDDRNAYLAAKLLTIFVEHPVIFLGYSLQDRNVRTVLTSIARCLTQDNIDELRDRLIFVQWDPSSSVEIGPHSIQIDNFMITVMRVRVPDFTDLYLALSELPRVFPAKLLRRLKEHVYELVLQDDPDQRLVVADIEDDRLDDVEVVFGVGIKDQLGHLGYVGLGRWDLIDDVIDAGTSLNGLRVVKEVLPEMLRHSGNAPVYKYLRDAELLTKAGLIKKTAKVDPRIEDMAAKHRGGDPANKAYPAIAPHRLSGVSGIAELEAKRGVDEVLKFGTCMPASRVDIGELRTFLRNHRDLGKGNATATNYAKLVCYLDWLEFGDLTRAGS